VFVRGDRGTRPRGRHSGAFDPAVYDAASSWSDRGTVIETETISPDGPMNQCAT
jgi:hypothetical protein